MATQIPVGAQIREWRMRRRMSQMDLALDAEISTRHLSFVETGRSAPSRTMVLTLAERLRVPHRQRNHLLLAAGYAPSYAERSLDDPELAPARAAVRALLTAYEPWPAIAIDRHWTLIEFNRATGPLLADVAPWLREPPVNVLRLSLHPEGMGKRIANLPLWRATIFQRLREQIEASADPVLHDLLVELRGYPDGDIDIVPDAHMIAIPLEIDTPDGRLSFISATTIFGTPVDVTLSELAIEIFLPADAGTIAHLNQAASARLP